MRTSVAPLAVLLFSTPAFAWLPPCGNYADSSETLLRQQITGINGSCVPIPLQLVRTQNGANTVDAWAGGYSRSVEMASTYEIDHFDVCSGSFLSSENRIDTAVETLNFNIVNPNLGDDSPSFAQNAPLTDQEAQEALPESLARCNALQPGDWP